jgi:hypothetical protein
MSLQIDPAVGLLAALAIALLLAGAAFAKLRDRAHFAATLAAYRIVPAALLGPASWALPCAELLLSAALLAPASRAPAAVVSAALLLAYGAAIGINLRRGRYELDCGCEVFGRQRPIAAWMLGRNVILGAAALVAALPSAPRGLEAVDALTLLGGLAVLAPAYLAAEQLLAQRPAPRHDAVHT